jgi:hypothetical protein
MKLHKSFTQHITSSHQRKTINDAAEIEKNFSLFYRNFPMCFLQRRNENDVEILAT